MTTTTDASAVEIEAGHDVRRCEAQRKPCFVLLQELRIGKASERVRFERGDEHERRPVATAGTVPRVVAHTHKLLQCSVGVVFPMYRLLLLLKYSLTHFPLESHRSS